LATETAATRSHQIAADTTMLVRDCISDIAGGDKIIEVAARLTCMSITMSRLPVRSYAHIISTL
jgi:hypothetical protein